MTSLAPYYQPVYEDEENCEWYQTCVYSGLRYSPNEMVTVFLINDSPVKVYRGNLEKYKQILKTIAI